MKRVKKEAIVKFNSGNLALLCSGCRTILKTGQEFSKEELKFVQGEAELPAHNIVKHVKNKL